MNRKLLCLVVFAMMVPVLSAQAPGQTTAAPVTRLQWGPAPDSFPKDAQWAIVSGDPLKPGDTIRDTESGLDLEELVSQYVHGNVK